MKFLISICLLVLPATAQNKPNPPGNAQATQTANSSSAPLTNSDIVSLLSAGLGADLVIAKIKTSKCAFDTSPAELKHLKSENVPEGVILAMVQASDVRPPNASAESTPGSNDEQLRIYVTNSQSWSMYGSSWIHGRGSSSDINGSSVSSGGANPQTVEIIKTFGERCPAVVDTNQPQRATYVVTLDHEGGKGLLRHRNKIAVFNRVGDVIFSKSTITLGDAVKDACGAIHKDAGR